MEIEKYFKETIDRKASDLHLVAGSIPALRIGGDLVPLASEVINNGELVEGLKSFISQKLWDSFEERKSADFSHDFFGSRFRINVHYQEGRIGISARLIPSKTFNPKEIRFNETIYNLTHLRDGLILVTGPSGSGKSTTVATMVDIINSERRAHIITIEDPIEYLFQEKQSIIEQRELGSDTLSFSSALKYALRQDPNVIMVGEMRDLETISAALTAAETGHLVISTLHTPSAPETVARIVDIFPNYKQQQILIQLSSTLRAVVAQQLIPKIDGGMVVAREMLVNTRAVASLIRRNQIEQMYSVIQTSKKDGMVTMNTSIDQLKKEGIISEDMAQNRKRNMDTKAAYY